MEKTNRKYYAAVGHDGKRFTVWGTGSSCANALKNARQQAQETACDIPLLTMHQITFEQFETICLGKTDWPV